MAKKNMSPNSLANIEAHKIQKGEVRNPAGRTPLLRNSIKKIPRDMQQKVYGILAYALTLPDEAEAKKYLECQQGELGQYGFVLQIAIKNLLKDGWGWNAFNDILDRLYGKPKIVADVSGKAEGVTIVVKSKEEKDKLEDLGKMDI